MHVMETTQTGMARYASLMASVAVAKVSRRGVGNISKLSMMKFVIDESYIRVSISPSSPSLVWVERHTKPRAISTSSHPTRQTGHTRTYRRAEKATMVIVSKSPITP